MEAPSAKKVPFQLKIRQYLVAKTTESEVKWAPFRKDDMKLDTDKFGSLLDGNTALVAVGYAANSCGTINDIKELVRCVTRLSTVNPNARIIRIQILTDSNFDGFKRLVTSRIQNFTSTMQKTGSKSGFN